MDVSVDAAPLAQVSRYRSYEMVLGWPEGEWIGNMLMMAHKDARSCWLLPPDWMLAGS